MKSNLQFDFLAPVDPLDYQNNQAIKVVLGISGGVDSSVSAYLLQRQGYQVECLFMKNWEEDDDSDFCLAAQDLADAKQVCEKLGLKLHAINFSAEYWDLVFENFLSEFKAGRTPNPDILCNKEIKFKAFLNYATEQLNADYIATGHYVRKAKLLNSIDNYQVQANDGEILLRGVDGNKDQSYFLYNISYQQIEKSLFPVGELEKHQVREIAQALDLITAKKKDSTGICFIGERKFKDFLANYIPASPGKIVDLQGNQLGTHYGTFYYTIGQRKGLGIGGVSSQESQPWYVAKKDLKNNLLIVAQGHDSLELYANGFVGVQLNWLLPNPSEQLKLITDQNNLINVTVKIRYRAIDAQAQLELLDNDQVKVHFVEPQLAVTPGQSAVFYHQEVCLGGAIIDQEINS